jgi:GR25 family glycosyltransferase involved in LPS biosynthesis
MAPLIYVINLDRDAERLASIRDNLAKLGLGFERLPAVIGKEVPEWEKLVDLSAYAWQVRETLPRSREERNQPVRVSVVGCGEMTD